MNSNDKKQKGGQKKGVKFDDAMTKAFSEIFHNLKEIETDTKKQRERVDLHRRRQSAPASMLTDVTERLKEPEKELENKLTTQPASSTMHWVLDCCEEEGEDEEQYAGSEELSLDFLLKVISGKKKTASK
ncbi:uncharacterized protein LOC144647133 [Oculina patagonica]